MHTKKLVGLNVLRAIAIFTMVIAHSIRTQSNFSMIFSHREKATFFDQALLFFIDVEPIISAFFLFIAGFSLTLSFSNRCKQSVADAWPWLRGVSKKALSLYLIASLFFIAEHGFQFPDVLVSPGILSIIGLSIGLTAFFLTTAKPFWLSGIFVAVVILITYVLEQEHIQITGLNTGPGGTFPLICLCPLGAILGSIYQRWQDNGLFIALVLSAIVSIFALTVNYPWTFTYESVFQRFSFSYVDQIGLSLKALFSAEQIGSSDYVARYWNHSSIFPLRVIGILVFTTLIFIKLFQNIPRQWVLQRATHFLNYLGSHALSLYIIHLLLLAIIEVTGLKTWTGWQTWILVITLIGVSAALVSIRERKALPFIKHLIDGLDPDTQ